MACRHWAACCRLPGAVYSHRHASAVQPNASLAPLPTFPFRSTPCSFPATCPTHRLPRSRSPGISSFNEQQAPCMTPATPLRRPAAPAAQARGSHPGPLSTCKLETYRNDQRVHCLQVWQQSLRCLHHAIKHTSVWLILPLHAAAVRCRCALPTTAASPGRPSRQTGLKPAVRPRRPTETLPGAGLGTRSSRQR